MVPNFLVIGAQKSGTTSLINYLSVHPEIYVPEDKEVSLFYEDEEYNKRFINFPYHNHYRRYNGQRFAGNAPVNILFFAETTAKNIFKFNPNMKLIAILRNPIERAYSAYWYNIRCGLETKSFDIAIKREKDITDNGTFLQKCNFTYISHGYYYEQLCLFLSIFSKENLLVVLYDDFKINPKLVLNEITNFLSLHQNYLNNSIFKKYNAASKPKIKWFTNMVYNKNVIKNIYNISIPISLRNRIHYSIILKLLNANLTNFTYPQMNDTTKQYLNKIFKKHNNNLENLLNKDLSIWNNI